MDTRDDCKRQKFNETKHSQATTHKMCGPIFE
jgi:hypothetical protein